VATWIETRSRVNRDDLRKMLHSGPNGYSRELENAITAAQEAQVTALLKAGRDVIVDDMNLRQQYARRWAKIADLAGAEFDVVDLTNIPVEECIRRDAARLPEERVGARFITEQHVRYLAGKTHPLPWPTNDYGVVPEPYVPPGTGKQAIIVDLDGTVALLNGRSPYDVTTVSRDLPNAPVIRIARDMMGIADEYGDTLHILFTSGRSELAREDTVGWLAEHFFGGSGYAFERGWARLFMRPEGDGRRDSELKLEIFNEHIRNEYDVVLALDDRNQVVDLWRSLGLTCLQVAPGDF
jgi:hypothetical protein